MPVCVWLFEPPVQSDCLSQDVADILADCDFTDLCPLFEQELLFLREPECHGFWFNFAWHRQECNTMRLAAEGVVGESEIQEVSIPPQEPTDDWI